MLPSFFELTFLKHKSLNFLGRNFSNSSCQKLFWKKYFSWNNEFLTRFLQNYCKNLQDKAVVLQNRVSSWKIFVDKAFLGRFLLTRRFLEDSFKNYVCRILAKFIYFCKNLSGFIVFFSRMLQDMYFCSSRVLLIRGSLQILILFFFSKNKTLTMKICLHSNLMSGKMR